MRYSPDEEAQSRRGQAFGRKRPLLSLRFGAFEGSGRWRKGPSDGRPAERVRRIADGTAGYPEPDAPEPDEGV